MREELPPQRPEGRLIQEALEQDGRSIRQIAEQAGISDARWRQIVKGSMTTGGHVTAVVAPAGTLARMAQTLGLAAERLREVGRDDAADELERLPAEAAAAVRLPSAPSEGLGASAIDLIYASTSMNARQKLEAIKKVLQLQAQAEAEQAVAEDEADPVSRS